MIKSIGVGNTERELLLLENIARLEIEKLKGQLRLFQEPDDILIDAFISTLYNEDITLQGPDLVFGALFDKVGYRTVLCESDYLKALVVSRLVMPGSKLRTVEYLQRHSKLDVGIHAIYKYMNKLNAEIIDNIQRIT